MPLPQIGAIGCLPQSSVESWAASQGNNVVKYENVSFREAVSRVVDLDKNILLFQPDTSNIEVTDYNAPCPEGWTANIEGQCIPPSSYVPPQDQPNCPAANMPANFAPGNQNREGYVRCEIAWPKYPRGTIWVYKGTLPQSLLFQMIVPDQRSGQCPLTSPVYYFELPDKSSLQECLLDRTSFANCFREPGIIALQRINREQNTRCRNFSLLVDAMKNGEVVTDYQRRVQSEIQNTKDVASRMKQEAEYQLKMAGASGLAFVKGILDRKVGSAQGSNEEVQKYLENRSYDVGQEIQNRENQEGRLAKQWRLTRRVHELEEEWMGRFQIIFWIMLIILVGIAVFAVKQGFQNMNLNQFGLS
jgi:hypothetical protein